MGNVVELATGADVALVLEHGEMSTTTPAMAPYRRGPMQPALPGARELPSLHAALQVPYARGLRRHLRHELRRRAVAGEACHVSQITWANVAASRAQPAQSLGAAEPNQAHHTHHSRRTSACSRRAECTQDVQSTNTHIRLRKRSDPRTLECESAILARHHRRARAAPLAQTSQDEQSCDSGDAHTKMHEYHVGAPLYGRFQGNLTNNRTTGHGYRHGVPNEVPEKFPNGGWESSGGLQKGLELSARSKQLGEFRTPCAKGAGCRYPDMFQLFFRDFCGTVQK